MNLYYDSNDMQHKIFLVKFNQKIFLVIMELVPKHVLMLEEEKILVF